MSIVVTGCAGFIGYHLCLNLLKNNKNVIGIDSINNYYSIKIKNDRLKKLKAYKKFKFYKIDLIKYNTLNKIFKSNKINIVIHLAAQAGVRYSIKNPYSYTKNNLVAFSNIIEFCKVYKIKHLLFASSSSVYGNLKKFPLSEKYVCKPIQYYAATKLSNEIIAESYCKAFDLKITGLRFFTVYGPYGRPDMALFKFTNSIIKGENVELYNNGNHIRDFTYIDDAINSIVAIMKNKKRTNKFDIVNIASGRQIELKKYLGLIENYLEKKAKIKFLPIQLGDVRKTHANINKLKTKYKYKPKIKPVIGVKLFIDWYLDYFNYK